MNGATTSTPRPVVGTTPVDRAALRGQLDRRHTVLPLGAGRTVRFETRAAAGTVAVLVATAALAVYALCLGSYGVVPGQVLAAIFGHPDDPLAGYFVTDVRAPRVLCAVLVGAALGTSGSIFQTVSGNPLGSPDVIGFTAGSATGALVVLLVLHDPGPAPVAVGALTGGVASAILVYLLAWRGGVSGLRLVLVGIGVAAALHAVDGLLVVRASLDAAQTAQQWLVGSLANALWPEVRLLAIAVAVLLPCGWLLARPLSILPMGDDVAAALGVRTEPVRLLLVLVAVALIAVATAATGPIAFVALAAPQVARRIGRTATPAIAGSAAVGALSVLGSDVAAQHLVAPTQLAVGVVTGTLGGAYLIVLLATEYRGNRA